MTRPTLVALFSILALLAGFFCTALGGEQTAGLVFYYGRVVTMIAEGDVHEAIAVAGNRILYVGGDTEALAFAGPGTERIDLGGRAAFPGFIDPHTHLLNDSWNVRLSPTETQERDSFCCPDARSASRSPGADRS